MTGAAPQQGEPTNAGSKRPGLVAMPNGPRLTAVPDSRNLIAGPNGPTLTAVPDGRNLATGPNSPTLAAVAGLRAAATARPKATATAAPGVAAAADLRAVPDPAPIATKLCVDGHPNNAYGRSCRICGRRFEGASEVVTMMPTSVGRLLLEDGSAVQVANGLLIGRHPMGDDQLDTLTVTGRQVSRRHLLLEVRGWDLCVLDCNSTNGTFLTRRGERGRRRVPTDAAVPVRIGDSIHFGSRQALVISGTG